MSINHLDQDDEKKAIFEEFIKHPQGFLLFTGINGTGKTYSALSIYNMISPFRLPYYDHEVALFTTQTDLNIKWLKDIINQQELLDKLNNTKLLVIDDLGTRTPSDTFMDFLYAVADARYTHRREKGTIITTNLRSAAMRDKFGDAFFSRVASGKTLVFEGKDRRFNENGV